MLYCDSELRLCALNVLLLSKSLAPLQMGELWQFAIMSLVTLQSIENESVDENVGSQTSLGPDVGRIQKNGLAEFCVIGQDEELFETSPTGCNREETVSLPSLM